MPTLKRILIALAGSWKVSGQTSTAFFQPRADGLAGTPPLFFPREDRLPPEVEERPFRFRD